MFALSMSAVLDKVWNMGENEEKQDARDCTRSHLLDCSARCMSEQMHRAHVAMLLHGRSLGLQLGEQHRKEHHRHDAQAGGADEHVGVVTGQLKPLAEHEGAPKRLND